MKIVIAGGTGFIGRAVVVRLLSEGHEVCVLSRHASGALHWDGKTAGLWCGILDGADAVINLCGENCVKRTMLTSENAAKLPAKTHQAYH
ncbi:MAG: NAD-dependent epimerase/dehydratase family protein [Candidatus Omnitrophica bacterium]|nr:NAD-dependent epimerase/dehydratase family protein [Candidatus Omnitrophota bacterium]